MLYTTGEVVRATMFPAIATRKDIKILSPAKTAVAEALAAGKSFAEAARLAGVTPKTVYNYRQDPEVQRYVYHLQCAKQEETGGQTNTLLPDIVTILKEIVTGTRINSEGEECVVLASNFDKIQAARVLLQANAEYQYRLSLERKISALEERLFKLLTKEAHELAAIQEEDLAEEREAAKLEEEELRLEREQEESDTLDIIAHSVLDAEEAEPENPPENDVQPKPTLQEIQEVLSKLDIVTPAQTDFLDNL